MNTLPRRALIPDVSEAGDRSVVRSIDQHIGQELRALYNEVLAEPIPDRFLNLIDQLGANDQASVKAVEEVEA
jgi:Anti-sigma factor NepR